MFKEKKEGLIVGCFKEMIRLHMLTPTEYKFAAGLISAYDFRGSLSARQVDAGWKMLQRLIQERDPFEPFPLNNPAF